MEIQLNNGMVANISDGKASLVQGRKFYAAFHGGYWEARRVRRKADLPGLPQSLHGLVAGAPRGATVECLDGNKLNCRDENLRIVGKNKSFKRRKSKNKPALERYIGTVENIGTGWWRHIAVTVPCGPDEVLDAERAIKLRAARFRNKYGLKTWSSIIIHDIVEAEFFREARRRRPWKPFCKRGRPKKMRRDWQKGEIKWAN